MRRTVLAAVVAVSLALALAAPATAKSGPATAAAAREAAEHARIVSYWTPERMAAAKPRDIVVPLGTKPTTQGKPTKGGGGGGSTSSPSLTSTGAAWSFGGPVSETTGKVFFTMNGSNYVCSGSLVQSGTANQVVSTAGHCVHEGDGSGSAGYATNFAFYPGWTGSTSTAPKYTGLTGGLFATDNWQANGAAHGAYPDDAAFVRVTGSGVTATPPTVEFTRTTAGQMFAFGYPAAQKYKGNKLIYCSGEVAHGYYDGDDTISMPCDMTGGSSGGPWFKNFDTTAKYGVQASVNSYGYSGMTRMWGPVFDEDQEGDAFRAAAGLAG